MMTQVKCKGQPTTTASPNAGRWGPASVSLIRFLYLEIAQNSETIMLVELSHQADCRSHRGLDVQRLDVVPTFLTEAYEEVDGHCGIG